MIIAIDGPAASGKGSLGRRLAEKYNLAYLDTGLLYRAVGLAFLQRDPDGQNSALAIKLAEALNPDDLQDEGLRGNLAARGSSIVAAIPEVRAALLGFQRTFAQTPPAPATGAILDGRDIGTVVCPNADIKLFITANMEIRAQRRHKELQNRGFPSIYEDVLRDLQERDTRDSNRATAPLKPAETAHMLDTSDLGLEDVFAKACAIVDSALQQRVG